MSGLSMYCPSSPWIRPCLVDKKAAGVNDMAMVPMQEIHAFTDSTALIGDPAALQRRAAEDGYLYFRGLLPRQDVLSIRSLVLVHCQGAGWLDEQAPLLEGRVRAGQEPRVEGQHEEWARFYRLLYTRRELHAFNQHPRMLEATRALFGGPVLAHARMIVRTMFPGTATFTTPPHQDCFYIGGTLDTWTAWVPLGDCPEQLGGLAVAVGSHRRGQLPVHAAQGAGGHAVEAEDMEWAAGEFAAGDVLLFHSCTIHQARDNRTADRIRLSCDFRYQALSEPVRSDSLEPHAMWSGDPSWERVYSGWAQDDPLRYYWRSLPVRRV